MPEKAIDLVEREIARRAGCRAELCVTRERSRRYDARGGGIDSLSFSESISLGLRVFVDGRMGYSYCFRTGADDVARTVESALFSAASSDPDDAHGLPDPGGDFPHLPLYDPACERVGDPEKSAFAEALEHETLARDPRMKRVRTATIVESVGDVRLWNSAGCEGVARESRYSAWVDSVAYEGEEGQTGYGYGFSRRFDALRLGDIASEAAGKAVRMLGARPLKTGRYAAILENGAAAELLEVLAPSFLASNVAKGRSFFAGSVGKAVASPAVSVSDDPLDPAGSGASPFDGEGTPCRRNVLIEGGLLKGYLADAFWGRKMKMGTTGSSRRASPKAPPTAGISNLRIDPGERSLMEMRRDLGAGVMITEFLGIHTADPVSGDFSVGAAGIRFEGGEEMEPVRGFAVSGNVLSLLSRVVGVGSDFRWFGNVGSPSLAVSGIDMGGD